MSSHPILPLDVNESNHRKLVDKINELVRHVSIAPTEVLEMADFSLLGSISTGNQLIKTVQFGIYAPTLVSVHFGAQIDPVNDAGSVYVYPRIYCSLGDEHFSRNARFEVSELMMFSLDLKPSVLFPFHVVNGERVPVNYEIRLFCRTNNVDGNYNFFDPFFRVTFEPHYGQDLVPRKQPYV
jgi:hypothetical protein